MARKTVNRQELDRDRVSGQPPALLLPLLSLSAGILTDHPSVHASPCLWTHPFIHPFIQVLSPSIHLPIHLPAHPFIYSCIQVLIHLSFHPFLVPHTHSSIHVLIHLSTHLSTHPPIHPSTHPFTSFQRQRNRPRELKCLAQDHIAS